ncbi:hypothetical protein QJS10_CPA02g00010 [Acorus calamus]|uniref:Tunicamycin induced 1 n=1 Tax=Acorus calamus TaxID=4465 RepID=A0AAV9FEM8_ACOCL|nr:hypothetical protein QJS10_CPA02g00010 [Acorus calamus]
MGNRSLINIVIVAGLIVFNLIGCSNAHSPSSSHQTLNHPRLPKAISDLKDVIVKRMGLHGQDDKLMVRGFDARDALVGQSVAYEFDIEFDNKVIPVRLVEDVNRWAPIDLPFFGLDEDDEEEPSKDLAEVKSDGRGHKRVSPVLAPFQLTGPMELWIHDADDIRLSLPHDVDAGILRKVMLADGAAVTVKGARSVSLRHPLELPLPLNRTGGSHLASGLIALAERLRAASRTHDLKQQQPLLSLRIVGPTSLTSSSQENKNRLKLKRLGPGLVELSSPSVPAIMNVQEDPSPQPLPTVATATMWPLTSVNGSDANLRGLEELLTSVIGEKGEELGSFRLLKADVSAQTYIKIGFEVVKELGEGDVDWSAYPEWKTRPERARMHFEVLGRLEGERKVVPERVVQVQPFVIQDTVANNVFNGNISLSTMPTVQPPHNYFTL